jgi:hypothetical protein
VFAEPADLAAIAAEEAAADVFVESACPHAHISMLEMATKRNDSERTPLLIHGIVNGSSIR